MVIGRTVDKGLSFSTLCAHTYELLPLPNHRKTSRSFYKKNRKAAFITASVLLIFGAFCYFDVLSPAAFSTTRCHHPPHKTLTLDERVEKILSSTPLIDGHNDLPIFTRFFYNNSINSPSFTFNASLFGHVDLPRLLKGRVGGTFWSVFVPCPNTNDPNNFSDPVYYQSVHDTLQQIDLVKRLVAAYPEHLELATSSSSAMKAHKAGKIASFIGAEGLHQIGNSASTLRMYHDLGVRYVTLTHACNNKYADGAMSAGGPKWHGISPAGRDIIREMNRIGMMVDLSHVTPEVMRNVLTNDTTRAPVIFSHSSAGAICNHARNVPDDVLHLVKQNGGVVMVNFYPAFLCSTEENPATIDTIVEHIFHIANTIGWKYIGIGSDYDGIDSVPNGLEDVSKFPNLFKELLKRGVSDEQAEMLAGRNILRVWEQVEKVSETMEKDGVKPLEDEVGSLDLERDNVIL